jgi:flavodoxin
MKSIVVYCSKTGNTEKVAKAIVKGIGVNVDTVKLDLSPEGLLKDFSDSFTLDLSPYDLIFLGGWVMVMRVHPFLYAYTTSCKNLEGKNVAGFLTGGAGFSREHAYDDFRGLVNSRGARLVGFSYTPTLLGLTLTRKKLAAAEAFARQTMDGFKP